MNPPPPELKGRPERPAARVLGVRVDAIDRRAVLDRCAALLAAPKASTLVTANALLAMDLRGDPELSAACEAADVVTADSVGLVWAAAQLGQPALPRLPGIDLAIDLCALARDRGAAVYLLGAAPGVAAAAAARLESVVPGLRVAGTRDGFFDSAQDIDVIRSIAASGARLVLVALGMPKQEVWMHRNRARLPHGLYVGVGGSFDVWAGNLKRAPRWVQRLGLEWTFRLLQQPSRFRRMLRLPAFAWRVLKSRRGPGIEG